MPDAAPTSGHLAPEHLYAPCDPAGPGFETTRELEPFPGTLGQDEALEGLAFGLSMTTGGFNIFVLGPGGSGRASTVRRRAGWAESAAGYGDGGAGDVLATLPEGVTVTTAAPRRP